MTKNEHLEVFDQFLRQAEPTLLQLDFPNSSERLGYRSNDERSVAECLLGYIRIVNKHLYLRPDFCMLTNAGSENVVGSMEEIANFLCDHDGANLPIAGVRGDNLLPHVEEYLDRDVKLLVDGSLIPLSRLYESMIAMKAQLGAGPFAVALQEGARIVVAGSYDPPAPLIAGTVTEHEWPWNAFDCLATIALAAQVSPWLESMSKRHVLIEVGEAGEVTFPLTALDSSEVNQVQQQVKQFAETDSDVRQADVVCRYSHARIEPLEFQGLGIRGCEGKPAEGLWPVSISHATGYGVVRQFTAYLPAEVVNCSVDTRPAHEWL